MPCYYLVYQHDANGTQILVARKNLYYGGNRHQYDPVHGPLPQGNAGQYVIPGGVPRALGAVVVGLAGCQQEFEEEIGLDPSGGPRGQRQQFHCIGQERTENRNRNGPYTITYQRVQNVAAVSAAANGNISGRRVRDPELLTTEVVGAQQHVFGATSIPQLAHIREMQSQAQDIWEWDVLHQDGRFSVAERCMADPNFGWFIDATQNLVANVVPAP
ncbi:hypothetical protein H7827_27710 [Streptomyces sp. JH002]|uniref:hypothetical protein n=1 Tax=Streptomyces sp. JH002 TaxID=2763259 RepID=UPI003D80402A